MPFDVFQQVYLLSIASNAVNPINGTQTSLQKTLQKTLHVLLPLLPGWQLVWGPVVWKNKPDEAATGPDHSWYVAFHPNLRFEDGSVHPAYVIAVAGTPRSSEYVWLQRNFHVNSVADFKAWVTGGIQNAPQSVPVTHIVPGTPYIAKGTVDGVHLLLTTPVPEGAPSAGKTLLDFVGNVDASWDPRFVTTGHSLGGALSPSLALALVSAGVIHAQNTLTYPTAGPSPGNRGFTDLFTATFPARKSTSAKSYQGWNLNLVNTLDIVPQAWSIQRDVSLKQNLFNIPPIYGEPIIPFVLGLIRLVATFTLRSGVLYFPLPSQYFCGLPPSEAPKTLKEFIKLAVPQHVKAYFDEIGVPLPPGLNKSEMLGSGVSEKTEDETRFDYPVIAGFEWAREHPEEVKTEIQQVESSEEAKALLEESD